MIGSGSLELTQARVQARHGQRADDAVWQQLLTTRDLGALLAAARDSGLRPWVAGLTAQSDAPQIEAAMQRHWRATVDELAGWMPDAWRPAVAWWAVLADLPVLQHLARGGALPHAGCDDAAWKALGEAAPQARAPLLAGGRWSALATTWAEPQRLARAWVAEWLHRAPWAGAEAGTSLRELLDTLQRHFAAFAAAPPGSGEAMRRELQQRLRRLLRRATLLPTTGFVHLALCALDLERLRGELLRRVLFSHVRVA